MLICNKKTEKKPLTTKENWLLSFKYADYLWGSQFAAVQQAY